MKNICTKFSVYIIIALLLSGCTQLTTHEEIVNSETDCIQPAIKFAFPVNFTEQKINYIPQNILPLSPWQLVSSLPSDTNSEFINDTIIVSRTQNESINLWVDRLTRTSDYINGEKHALLVYNTQKDRWSELPNAFEIQKEIVDFYVRSNNEIWGIGTDNGYETLPQASRFVVRFDESQQEFQPLEFQEEMPNGFIVYDDYRSIFWVFDNEKDSIYAIDPETNEIVKKIEIPSLNIRSRDSIAVSQDGTIYILNAGNLEMWSDTSIWLIEFSPDKDTFKRININFLSLELNHVLEIFADNSGNLWLGDQSWMSSDGTWYEVIRSPIFIVKASPGEEHKNVKWGRPKILLEGSDGRLWFNFENGMVSLDPKKGEWCWFTTYQSNIVEDSDHNLWMIADGKLYKNPLGEK